MRKLAIIATLAFAFVACEEENLIPDWFTPSGEMVVIGVGDDGTRVSLDYDGKDNVCWTEGDILGIYCPEAASTAQGYAVCANIPATISALSDDKKSATIYPEIEYNAQTQSHTFYVYYPWKNSGASTVAGTPTLSGIQLSTTQDGDIAKSTITWAQKTVEKPASGVYGRIDGIKLVTPFAYVRFCFASAAKTDKQVSSVTMEAVTGTETDGVVTINGSDNSAVFCGTYNVDLTKQAVSGSEGAHYPESGAVTFTATQNVITVNQTAEITTASYDKSKGVLMHINSSDAFAGTGKYFKITVMFNDGTYAVTYKAAKNFEANHIYNYGFNIDNFTQETETEINVEPWYLITCDVAFD